MNDNQKSEISEHAWKYFSLHADQRLRTFHFYIIICAIIIGGLVSCFKETIDCRIGAIISLFLPFFSYIFFKLDQRNKQLIRHGEDALKFLESQYKYKDVDSPHKLKIFLCEESLTEKLKCQNKISTFDKLFTYSTCINSVFIFFGLIGILSSILFLKYG